MRSVALASIALLVATLSPADGQDSPKSQSKIKALIITGENNHKWRETTPHLKKVLIDSGYFDVDVTEDAEAPILSEPTKLAEYQVLVLNFNRSKRWTSEREKNFLDYVKNGGGLSVVHAADNAFPGWEDYDRLVGGTWRSKGTSFPERGTFHPPYGTFEVRIVDEDHPITKGIGPKFSIRDEMYTNLKLADNIKVLAAGDYKGKPQPLIFTSETGKGRMFQTALGHDLSAMSTPVFIDTLIRGTRWAAGGMRRK